MKQNVPEDAGMSSSRLERITPVMESFVKDNRLPGIMTLVHRKGKIVHFGMYGLMDIEAKKAIQEDAIFRIFSMTKPVTSMAIMMLLEEGRLNLIDPVSTYIPAFAKTKVCLPSDMGPVLADQNPAMTLHHLLTHTAGLGYFDSPFDESSHRDTAFPRDETLGDIVRQVAQTPLLFQPGTQWRYSIAVDVLGCVIEVVAGMPLGDFFKKRIFEPLGMKDTGFFVPAEKTGRLAQIYASKGLYDPFPIPPDKVPIGDITKPTTCPFGGAGLVSTLSDYLAFSTCLLHGGLYDGGRLLSRKTVAWMTVNHIPEKLFPLRMGNQELDHGFGLGFRVNTGLGMARTLTSVGEYGWGGAAQTHFWIDPAEDFIGLLMTQHMPAAAYPVVDRFRNLAYQAIDD